MNRRVRRTGTAVLALGLALAAGSAAYGSAGALGEVSDRTSTSGAEQAEAQAGLTERLDRGLISVPSEKGNLVSWRSHGTDPDDIAFNLYRGGERVNRSPIEGATNYFDASANPSASYSLRPVLDGAEQRTATSEKSLRFADYRDVPIQPPPGGTTPTGEAYTYAANDASVGDLDGDGEYELVLKWNPSNAKDNSQSGYTGNVFVDAYELDGTRLWRIDLGVNIRAGAHYTQFQVFDYDKDGSAEVAMKTADGAIDGVGRPIGDRTADYRNANGYILQGPEYLSIFDGKTGAAMDTVDFVPQRGNVADWGDSYGNRVDRFLAGTAYLDGSRPSLIMSRGYYTRAVVAAWNWNGESLSHVWTFDSDVSGDQYRGQGNHNLSIADVDADGKDEIMFGAMGIDDNGAPMYATGLGHGDAMHVSDFLPDRPGVEVWDIHESGTVGASLRNGATGELIWSNPNTTGEEGPGRAVAGDIFADNPGAEFWATGGGSPTYLQDDTGAEVGRIPGSANFLIWWDGDAQRELLDDTHIDEYGPNGDSRLLAGKDVLSNNGTKSNPALSADILGDWREEVIWRTSDSTALRIYSTAEPTDIAHPSLMEDRQYRVSVAWQNTAYNQPPHASFLTP